MNSNPFFNFGASIGAAMLGADRDELTRRNSHAKVMSSKAAAPFNRELCKIAAAAFEVDGAANTAPAILFQNLAASEEWSHGYDRFSDCVKRAMSKQAMLPVVAGLHDKLGGGVVKTLMATGALGGAGIGSLAFLLSRNARQTSSESAELLEKVKAFKQLRRDIEEDMKANDVLAQSKPARKEHYRA